MNNSRRTNSIRNSLYAVIAQILVVLLNFLIRTIFIRTLSVAYLGLNGLFTNILNVLSFAELGFGTAIVYAMYKPIAEDDYKKTSGYMNYFSNVYRAIGIFILVVGLCLIPYLNYFINDATEIPENAPALWIIYVMFLINSSASYFFNYKRSLVIATQNGYIDSKNQLEFNFIKCVFQFLALILFESYIIYLVIQIGCTILGNVFISIKADKMFPYLNENKEEKLTNNEKKDLRKNIIAMAFHKFGSVVVSGVDNILISKFVGIVAMGCYSNYTLLTSTIKTAFAQVMTPVTASVGNFVSQKDEDEIFEFFHKLLFVNAYGAIFCCSCLMSLSNEFIKLLWGEEYIFPTYIVFVFLFNFYIDRMRQSAQIFIDTNGLFWPIKWKSFIEAFVNLIASLVLLLWFRMGIFGIIVGTLISNLTTNFWWEPYVVYKYSFKRKMYDYFIQYFFYTLTLIISVAISYFVIRIMPEGFVSFLFKCLVAAIVPNIIFVMLYHRSKEFAYLRELVKQLLNKFKFFTGK